MLRGMKQDPELCLRLRPSSFSLVEAKNVAAVCLFADKRSIYMSTHVHEAENVMALYSTCLVICRVITGDCRHVQCNYPGPGTRGQCPDIVNMEPPVPW